MLNRLRLFTILRIFRIKSLIITILGVKNGCTRAHTKTSR